MRKISKLQLESRHTNSAEVPDYFGKASLRPGKGEKVCTGRDLAKILAGIKLSDMESAAGQHDRKIARKQLIAPATRWP
jgi:hypothetical protein